MKGLLIISGLGLLAMLAEVFRFRRILLPLVLLGLAASYVFNVFEWKEATSISYFDNMIFFDRTAIAFSGIIVVTAFLWFILANSYFSEESSRVDHFALVLFALVGALMLTSFRNMTTLFLGIEIMSIPMYVLAASRKKDIRSNEAGFKYLLMGAFASAFLLFGIALVYGASGSFDLSAIRDYLSGNITDIPLFFYAGVILIFAAMCFKIAAAPFHVWTPDVYEGAPTPITAFLSTASKAAAFAIFARIFYVGMHHFRLDWQYVLAAIAALSMLVGNLAAITQENIKRLLAYSSIGHAGYVLLGILSVSEMGLRGVLVYSVVYVFATLGIWATVLMLEKSDYAGESVDDFEGLHRRAPFWAFAMVIFLLSLGGIPPTSGFIGKYFLFYAAVGAGFGWLAILAVLMSAVSMFYYVRIVSAMYLSDGREGVVTATGGLKFVAVVALIVTLFLGLWPAYFIDEAGRSGRPVSKRIADAVR